MHAGRVVAALMVWPALAAPAFGQTAPTGFRDLTWGATQAEVIRAFPEAQCFTDCTELSDWRCILVDENLHEVSVDVVLYGYDTSTVVGMVGFTLVFDSADARRLVEAFVARYGRWSRVVNTEFVTRSGTRFPSAKWAWHFPNVEIRVDQDTGKLGNAHAMVMWTAGLTELLTRQRQWKQRGGEDAEEASR